MKALYRRAQAYRHRDAFEEALADITSAIRLAPGDTLLRRELALLRNKMAAYHRKSKRVFRVVIGGDGAQRGSAGEGGDVDESEGGGASDCVEGSPGSEGDNDDELDVIGVRGPRWLVRVAAGTPVRTVTWCNAPRWTSTVDCSSVVARVS